MLCQSSYFIWSFMSLLTYYQFHAASGFTCPPGKRLTWAKTNCEDCPANQYNPKASTSVECRNCEPCGLFSYQVAPCTPTSNTKCRCHDGFIPYDKTLKRCRCPVGSGIKHSRTPLCEKCPPNTFTDHINTVCQPNLKCMQKIFGNSTTDVNCEKEPKTVVPPSSPLVDSQTSSSTTTAPTTDVLTTSANSITEPHDSRKHALWLACLAAFLLLILILKLSRCPKKKTDVVRQGSKCGKPVEESGEKFIPVV